MIIFQRETVSEIREGIEGNFKTHKKEIKDYTSSELDVGWDTYQTLEDGGNLCVIAAREDSDNTLVGYIAFVLNEHIHHNVLWAASTITYVHPAYRSKGLAKDMLEASEVILKQLDVHTMTCAVVDTMDYSPMLIREGFELIERTYGKEL